MRRALVLLVRLEIALLATQIAAGGCASVSRRGQPLSPEAAAYVDSVFVLMREHALAEGPVDWEALRRETMARAGGAQEPRQTHKALQWALKRVNPHSFLMLPERWAELERSEHERPPLPVGEMISGRIGYIALPRFFSQDHDLAADYSLAGQSLVRSLASKGACGWIIDLRRNSGGNMYPMLVAVGPLLGHGPAGFFRAGIGVIDAWGYSEGVAWIGTDTLARLPRGASPVPPLGAPVAVLTGPVTASSAEAIVVAFRGLSRAMSFGSRTAGFSSGNTGYRLSDGATVLLTELVLGDRTAEEYGDPIPPDRAVGGPLWNLFASPEDPTASLAADWLRSRPECLRKRATGKTEAAR